MNQDGARLDFIDVCYGQNAPYSPCDVKEPLAGARLRWGVVSCNRRGATRYSVRSLSQGAGERCAFVNSLRFAEKR